MTTSALTLITLGLLFLVGLIADFIGRSTFIPRVSTLMVFGFCIGPAGFDVLPAETSEWIEVVSDMALVMIGFILGSSLKISDFKKNGRLVVVITVSVVFATSTIVGLGLWVAGIPLYLAILYGGISPATAPAATVDVVHESKAQGPFTDSLIKIVATDDALGLIVFSLMLAGAQMILSSGSSMETLALGGRDIVLAVVVGLALGAPMSLLAGRVKPGEPTLLEALSMVFICGGVALWLDVSFLLAAMTMGSVVSNMAKHHKCPFCAIESIKAIEWPMLVLFFIFAGVSIELHDVSENALLIVLYILLRIVSRFIGAVGGARMVGAGTPFGYWMGMALMPQAGVALGMALTAAHRFPELGSIVTVIATSTVFFEIAGPICTRIALRKMKEVPHRL